MLLLNQLSALLDFEIKSQTKIHLKFIQNKPFSLKPPSFFSYGIFLSGGCTMRPVHPVDTDNLLKSEVGFHNSKCSTVLNSMTLSAQH